MKKQKRSTTSYLTNKENSDFLSKKINLLLVNAMPDNVLGMLTTFKEEKDGLLFYNKWKLIINDKNDYCIVNEQSKNIEYARISLLVSALHIIYYLNKPITESDPRYHMIYLLDQKYFRCLEDIKIYKNKLKNVNSEKHTLFLDRLDEGYNRLEKIKTQLSKIY